VLAEPKGEKIQSHFGLAKGSVVSRYRILEKLGEGGMGVVYKAEDTKFKRTVALKFLPAELTRDSKAKERLIHEAQAASALDHPNICTIYEIDEAKDGRMFIAMACYEGETVKQRIEREPMRLDKAIDIAIQVAQGLEKAHKKDIIHRDIKPANILVTDDGIVKILDFGLAKLAGQVRITKTGTTVGTVAYMSPEQARGEEIDQRSDIWSLGVVLYEILTGKVPFKGEYEQAVVYSILNEEPQSISSLRSGVPMELERVIRRTMAKSPEERYQRIGDLLADLRSLKERLVSGVPREQPITAGPHSSGRELPFLEGISVQDQTVQFQAAKDFLRVMLAQISPAYDPDLFAKEGLVKVKNPHRQAQKILKIIEHALSLKADLLLFPELAAPLSHLRAFEKALKEAKRDIVVSICYEHTIFSDLVPLLSEKEMEQQGLLSGKIETRLVNFCRIFIRAGPRLRVFTQIKLTPFFSEFSLSTRETLLCGKIVHRFLTNWGNFLFLICKDYVGEVGTNRRIPMFDFLKSLTGEGLHYILVSALNPEPEAFIHAARAFYYLHEKSGHTFTIILNAAELDNTAIIFPLRPHSKIRSTKEVEIAPLFKGKPGWGTQLRFPGYKERVISGTFVRLDRYKPMPTKEIFSPVYQAELLNLSRWGIESELLTAEETVPTQQMVSAPSILHNLPPQSTPFLGREEELKKITQLLANPSCRLLTLVGPGGIGKTRLALQAGFERIGEFPHGVYFIALAPLSSAELLVSTIADSFKFSLHSREDPKVHLLNYLREKEMLLVMDNFEHLLQGAGHLAEILETAPKVKLIVTSRERLNLRGEWIFEVGGMSLPQGERAERPEDYSGVQLFLQSARRIHPGFSFSEEQKPLVIRICQLVEGMPLGIELAAAWVRMLPCGEIIQEIQKNIGFLAASLRDVPERHRSLRAAFEHSWNLLSEGERSAFMRMSVFRGGFNREAAERVGGVSLIFLSALVDKSLLRKSSAGRYEMHELLRQYAEEKLSEIPGEKGKVQDLHCGYYVEFLHQREGHLKGKGQREALGEIGEEIENVREGWSLAVEQGKEKAVAKSLEGFFRFYVIRGLLQEGEEVFGRAVQRLSGGMDEVGEEKSEILGKVIARQGVFSCHLGLYGKARELLQESLLISRRLGSRAELAFSLNNLGEVAYRLGEHMEEARQLIEEGLAIRREIGDRWGIARCLNNLGNVTSALGESGKAKQLYQESLGIRREIGDRQGIAVSLSNLGMVAEGMGEYEQAGRLYRESLAIAREIGDRRQIVLSLNDLGYAAWARGEYEEAKRLHQESLAISKEIGHRWGKAYSLSGLGNVANTLGKYKEAKQFLKESLAISKEIGYRWVMTVSLGHLGNLAYRLGEYGQAGQLYQEGLAIARKMGTEWGIASSLSGLGDVAWALGEYQESKRYFYEALKTAMQIRAVPLALDALVRMATLLTKEGEKEKALQLFALTLQHPGTYKETKDRAAYLHSELVSQLPPQAVASATGRGKARKLEEVVRGILEEKK